MKVGTPVGGGVWPGTSEVEPVMLDTGKLVGGGYKFTKQNSCISKGSHVKNYWKCSVPAKLQITSSHDKICIAVC